MQNEIYKSFYGELQKEAGLGSFIGGFAKRQVLKAGLKAFDYGAGKIMKRFMGIKSPKRTPFRAKTIGNKAALYGGAAVGAPILGHVMNPKVQMRGY